MKMPEYENFRSEEMEYLISSYNFLCYQLDNNRFFLLFPLLSSFSFVTENKSKSISTDPFF